jgi:hypothetical protein
MRFHKQANRPAIVLRERSLFALSGSTVNFPLSLRQVEEMLLERLHLALSTWRFLFSVFGPLRDGVDRASGNDDKRQQRDRALQHHQHLCTSRKRKYIGWTKCSRRIVSERKVVEEQWLPVG